MYKKLMKEAEDLVEKLQKDITTGKTQMCENYGQKEINKFIDEKMSRFKCKLSYQETCFIENVLYKVSEIEDGGKIK